MIRLRSRNRLILKNTDRSSPDRAYVSALRLLSARDYTSARLREKLLGRGVDEADAETAIEQLITEGWLNDRRYAERFADSALASGRYYGVRLRQEMRRRGLPPDIVSEVLGRVLEEHDEAEEVRVMIERRFSGFSFSAASDREKRRVVGFLQRRGFSLSAIMASLRAAG